MALVDRKADTFDDFVGEIDLVVADIVQLDQMADILAQDTDYTCLAVAVVDKKHLECDRNEKKSDFKDSVHEKIGSENTFKKTSKMKCMTKIYK